MENGHSFINLRSDKKLIQIIRENDLVNELTIKNLFTSTIYRYTLLSKTSNTKNVLPVLQNNFAKSRMCRKFLQ